MNSEDYEGGFDQPDIEALLASIASDFRGWAEGFVPLIVGDADPSAAELLARSFFAMDPRAAHGVARMIFQSDQRAVLDAVAAPCTLVHVSRDFAAPPCVGRYMQARMLAAGRCAAAAMETIDSVGHFPQLVAPQQVLDVLEGVMLRHGGGGGEGGERGAAGEQVAAEVAEADGGIDITA